MSEQKVKSKTNNKGFFAVSKNDFLAAWELGLNPALAYLIIAQGTGGDHVTSAWSANAVAQRIGVDWSVANKAIKKLLDEGLMTNVSKNKKPRYKLNISDKPKMIWLPKIIIEDTIDKPSAIKRLKAHRDPTTTRIFVLLYSYQLMPKYGGINYNLLWRDCDIGITLGFESMELNCWNYQTGNMTVKDIDFVYEMTGKEFDKKHIQTRFWNQLDLLKNMGLLEEVFYVINEDDEILFPIKGRHSHENRVPDATIEYFGHLYEEHDMGNRDNFPDFMTYPDEVDIQVKGIFRMRLEANTELNSDFYKAMYAKVDKYCTGLNGE
ncbi:MAG: hypothetical protein KGV56_03285 [Gammaproteobacteria bacterium]|nr:hypothetical protein [Gammaproteobacteria bacterium]